MKTRTMMSVLLLSAVCATPSFASWFSRPETGTVLNIGSAPNPTPQDLHALYGRGPVATTIMRESRARVSYKDRYVGRGYDLSSLEGRTVFGPERVVIPGYVKSRERLGYILAVDEHAKLAELQTAGGIAVTVPTSLLVSKGDVVMAPTMSRTDVIAMAKTQTGRTVAINLDASGRTIRG